MFDAHHVGMGLEAVMSRLIEVTNLPLFRAVEIGRYADKLADLPLIMGRPISSR